MLLKQVSFLHLYHHYSIAWCWWIAIILFPGGDSYFGALLNSWIHVLLYSYYAFALIKFPAHGKGTLPMHNYFNSHLSSFTLLLASKCGQKINARETHALRYCTSLGNGQPFRTFLIFLHEI